MADAGQGTIPIFSIVMPTFDRQALLLEAIESVMAQTFPDWELIVVDDGSPSMSVVPDDARITLMRNVSSQGPAAARNRGLSLATGRYITFLDDDDLWGAHRLANALAGHESSDVVVCDAGRVGTQLRTSWHQGKGAPHDWILNASTPPLGTTSVRREMCPTFDATYPTAEDLDWWLRLTEVGTNVGFSGAADWIWRHHLGPRHGIGVQRRIEGRKLLMERHEEYFATHARARAFAWRRIGLLYLDLGQPREAGKSALRSLKARPGFGGVKLLIKAAFALSNRKSR